MEQPIKDYNDELDESEYSNFSGAIIVISLISICGVMLCLLLTGVL